MWRTVLVLALCCGTAHAEDSDEPEPVRLAPVWIHGSLDGVTARLGLRFHVAAVAGQQQIEIQVPVAGLATGAVVTVDGVTHRLALDPAEHATEKYGALIGGPTGRNRPWVVTIAPGGEVTGDLNVSIAAPHDAVLTLDLEVEAPTCFHRDQRFLAMPAAWRSSVDRSLKATLADASPCSGRHAEVASTWIAFSSSVGAAQPFGEKRIVATAAHVQTQHGDFSRIEIDLASQISHVPEDLFTVFVVDGSRSLTQEEVDAQTEVIKSYVAHAPHSQVQIVAYARKAHALLPGWMAASHAGATIARELEALELANGSNLDAGVREASKWLEAAHGTRRIVVFSDQRISDRIAGITPETFRALLPVGTLAHVVAIDQASDTPSHGLLVRDDAIQFAGIAIASEGMAMQASGQGPIDALALVRPIALERILVHSENQLELEENIRCAAQSDLAEGSGCVMWSKDGGPLRIKGLLWNHTFSRSLVAASQPQQLSRMLTGLGAVTGEASDELAHLARAVDSAWALFGSWSGTDGYGDVLTGYGFGAWGCGCGSSDDVGIGVGHGALFSRGSVADQISRATAACHITHPATIKLELTMDEIVDVTVTSNDADRECLTEAVWAAPLALPDPVSHEYLNVTL